LSPKQVEHQQHAKAANDQPASGGSGLDQDRFQALLQASRSPTGTSKALDLRKEVAWKAHKSKQIERRALFLSKIEALPSPTAASLPVTPPESPAVFHFTLPSPGLVSPLALFEALEKEQARNGPPPVRIEQVDFRAKARKEAALLAKLTGNVGMSMKVHGLAGERDTTHGRDAKNSRKNLPSLDDISKRLAGNVTVTRAEPTGNAQGRPAPLGVSRLPAFLKRASTEIKNEAVVVPTQEAKQQFLRVPPPRDASLGRPKVQSVGKLAFAPVPGVTKTTEVPQPTSTYGPISRPQALTRLSGTDTTGVVSNVSTFKFPTTGDGNGHAAAFRPRPERPSSLSSLQTLTSSAMSGNHIVSRKTPTPLTAEALQQLAKRTERGSQMVERLKRRVSAPAEMSVQQQQPAHRNMRGGF
jgi:hypothetical protein